MDFIDEYLVFVDESCMSDKLTIFECIEDEVTQNSGFNWDDGVNIFSWKFHSPETDNLTKSDTDERGLINFEINFCIINIVFISLRNQDMVYMLP